jgi:hypothetical protein
MLVLILNEPINIVMDVDCPAGAGIPVTSPQLYSAGHTDDYRQDLFYISHRYPEAPLSLQVVHAKSAAICKLSIASSEIFQLEIRWCINGNDIHMNV